MMNGPTPKKENKRMSGDVTPIIDQQELHEMEEILKIKAAALKKEELDIQVPSCFLKCCFVSPVLRTAL
jgi:hypothetical protein